MSLTPNNNKSLLNLFEEMTSVIFSTLNCVKIGEIQSFDPATQTASVKILSKKVNEYNLNERELVDYTVLEQVPVVFPKGGSSYISYPVSAGDNCLLLFCDFELDGWWISGEARPSNFPRRHDLSDAIAFVGINSTVSLIQNFSNFLMLYYAANSFIEIGDQINITNSQVNVNGNLTVTQAIIGNTTTTSELHSTNGASGSFASADSKTITVVDGIITGIS